MIKAKVKTHLKGEKLEAAIRKAVGKMDGGYTTVGVHEGAGEYPDGTPVVNVALWNEYGTAQIPERSFIRAALHEHEGDINRWRKDLVREMVEGKMTAEKALTALGLRVSEMIKKRITDGDIEPPNAPSTADAKLRRGVAPRPLIDTGLLLRSIGFKVVLGEGHERKHGGGHGEGEGHGGHEE